MKTYVYIEPRAGLHVQCSQRASGIFSHICLSHTLSTAQQMLCPSEAGPEGAECRVARETPPCDTWALQVCAAMAGSPGTSHVQVSAPWKWLGEGMGAPTFLC